MRIIRHTEDKSRRCKREVVSTSLMKHAAWFPPTSPTSKVNWTIVPGGTLDDILRLWRERVEQATEDTTYLLHAFHNSIPHITEEYAEEMILHHARALRNFNWRNRTSHRLIWAEADYPPRNEQYFSVIDRVNVLMRRANARAGFPPCRIWRVTSPAQSPRDSRWAADGYHVSKDYLKPYFAFIRNYLDSHDM